MRKTAAALAVASLLSATALSAETVTELSSADRSAIRITIYNGNLAAVSETRRLSIAAGLNRLAFGDVAARIEPETALLEGGDFTFIEQTFDYDLLTPEKLIAKALGKTVTVARTNPATGKTDTEEATVLSANGGVVLQFPDRIEIFQQGEIGRAHV